MEEDRRVNEILFRQFERTTPRAVGVPPFIKIGSASWLKKGQVCLVNTKALADEISIFLSTHKLEFTQEKTSEGIKVIVRYVPKTPKEE
jgi:hypothetical protein